MSAPGAVRVPAPGAVIVVTSINDLGGGSLHLVTDLAKGSPSEEGSSSTFRRTSTASG